MAFVAPVLPAAWPPSLQQGLHRTLPPRVLETLKRRNYRVSTSAARRDAQRPSAASRALPDARGPVDLGAGTVLGRRYEVQGVLGRGGNAVTYRCLDADTGLQVAVKALSLRSLRDWKQLDLFQREAQTLESLDHPCIPRYLDAFEEDTENDRAFFLVQELAEGRDLEQMLGSGWRADEAEVSRIATELLKVLEYLGSRRPAVIHRDIKPANIVIEGGQAGGRVFLVDFGGVQSAAAVGDLGSTIVGTYGFMAPEQFRGAAQPASDLYGLGGALLYVVSGRPPSAFPVDRMRLDLSSVPMGSQLETVVEGLLEPVLEDRLTAEEALALLQGKKQAAGGAERSRKGGGRVGGSAFEGGRRSQQLQQFVEARPAGSMVVLRKPPGSRVKVTQRGPRLEIDIPPAKFDGTSVATGGFAIAWNAFVAFWTVGALAGGGILFALFSIPFWAAGFSLLKQAFGRQLISERLVINRRCWMLQQRLARLAGNAADWEEGAGKEAGGRSSDLSGAAMRVVGYINGMPQGQLVLQQGVETFALGEGLDPVEQEWLASVINTHLEERGGVVGGVGEGDEDGGSGGTGVSPTGMQYSEFIDLGTQLKEIWQRTDAELMEIRRWTDAEVTEIRRQSDAQLKESRMRASAARHAAAEASEEVVATLLRATEDASMRARRADNGDFGFLDETSLE